ncbi:MAG: IS256 family transposase [Flavobacteriales bacterium]|jgi:putative transposase
MKTQVRKKQARPLEPWEAALVEAIRSGRPLTGADGFFTPMIKRALEAALDGEMDNHLQEEAAAVEVKTNRRNGKTTKQMKGSMGNFELTTPRDRDGTFEPEIVKKRQTVITAEIDQKILSLYSHAMSYEDIRGHIRDFYGIEVSDAAINQITDRILSEVTSWRSRPLEEVYTILWMDAIHYKVRVDGMVINKAIYCVLGLDLDGKKDVLGFYLGENESSRFWLEVLQDLRNRGVKDVLIASTDNLSGFTEAIASIFPQAQCQLCIIHQLRNTFKRVATKDAKEVVADFKKVYQASNKEVAYQELELLKTKWLKRYPTLTKSWFENWDNLSTYFKYPEPIRRIVYTTNTVEAFHRMLRKATKTKGAFVSDNALLKIVYLTTLKAIQKWSKPIHNWPLVYGQLAIIFEGRIPN